eukprot:3941786-Rhodomonas_salina.1
MALHPPYALSGTDLARRLLRGFRYCPGANAATDLGVWGYQDVRVGVHVGSITAAMVGVELPRYMIYGPDVEITSQLESSADTGTVALSREAVAALARDLGEEWEHVVAKTVEEVRYCDSVCCYGTAIAYAATAVLVLRWRIVVSRYGVGVRYCDSACCSTRCARDPLPSKGGGTEIAWCYAMCGTEIAYGANVWYQEDGSLVEVLQSVSEAETALRMEV